ncbi:MAG: Ig-like domain-containing protein, partial [Acidobacteriota bacterium]|nr:Ig-like domain-containing protein [Acidobacteriota bacterium]
MNFSRFRFRTLIMPTTLALIFGALLFQSDHAWMKGSEQAFQSSISKSSEKATPRKANSLSHTGYVAEAKAAVSSAMAFTPLVSANKTVNTPTASPGNTLTYNINITNSGTTATTGVLFSDTIDANTTLVPGSVNTSPLALTDNYACTGNVGISVPAASGVLINDFDPDGTIPAIVGVNTAGTQGTVSLNPGNGSFTFNPAPGFEGTTTFSYTLSDGVFSDIGTVSITVSGMIWFIDDSVAGPGDGRLSAPFNSVANFNSLAADDPGDNIFIYSGNYSGALTLLNNQKLIGQGSSASLVSLAGLTLPPFSNALPATGGTRPSLSNTATLLTLGNGNLIRGFNVTNTGGTGISGNSFGNLTASEISITANNTSAVCGAALNLNNGNPTATFTSVSASGCTNGMVLTNLTGPVTVAGTGSAGSGGTIQNILNNDGVVLNTTSGLISLNYMIIQDITATNDATDALQTHSGADAIHGRAVSGGLVLTNSTIQRISDNAINGTVDASPVTGNPTNTTWSGLTLTNN